MSPSSRTGMFDPPTGDGTGMTVSNVVLNNETTIPQLGFGVFQVPPDQTAQITGTALEVGYRHIDTAQMYENEAGVGEAIKASGIARDELYITSKLNNTFHEPDAARRAFDETLDAARASTGSTCSSSTGRSRRSTTATTCPPGAPSTSSSPTAARRRSASPTSSRPTWTGSSRRPALVPGGQPDRGAPLLHQRGRPRRVDPPRRRGRGLVADRAGQGARRRRDRRDRRRARQDPVAGDPALAHRARRHRLPEVDARGADARELRHLRLHAHRPTRSPPSAPSTGARPAAPAPTRTPSTGSPELHPGAKGATLLRMPYT